MRLLCYDFSHLASWARWEWRAMCTHSRAYFSFTFCWNLLLNPVSIGSFTPMFTGCLGIVAHRSPTHKLHLDLTSWIEFFLSTFLGSRLATMVYRLIFTRVGEVYRGLSIWWQAPPGRFGKPPSPLSFKFLVRSSLVLKLFTSKYNRVSNPGLDLSFHGIKFLSQLWGVHLR